MIEYLKMVIVAIVSGLTSPLPTSSAAHYNFFANVVGLSGESDRLSFYYYGFILCFSLVVLLMFRRTVFRGFKLAFRKNNDNSRDNRYFIKNVLISLIPTIVLFIPVAEGKFLMDYMDTFLNVNGLILAGFACIITACVLVVAMWYTSKSKNTVRRAVDKKTAFRLSFYQLPCYVIPGFSHIASGAVNLFISDISYKNLVEQLYIYVSPSMFFVSVIKIIRLLLTGMVLDPVMLLIGAVSFILASAIVIKLTLKVNIRRLFAFFSIYSVAFGIFTIVISFFI